MYFKYQCTKYALKSKIKTRVFVVHFSFCAVMLALSSLPSRADLLAGAARVDITPDVLSRSIPLGGYAARKAAPATGVHDPIYARALVLSEGATKVAIVSLDLCFLPANVKAGVAKRLAETGETGIDAAHLFLSATHTHCAPDPLAMHSGNTFTKLKGWSPFDGKLLTFMVDKIALSIQQANKSLSSAQTGVHVGDENGANRNRRGEAAVDPALTVLKITRSDGTVIAAIVNFAAHPTLYDDKMMQISADWPGVMAADVEKSFAEKSSDQEANAKEANAKETNSKETNSKDNGSVCLFLNGAEGDASPNGVDDVGVGEAKVTTYGHRMSRLALEALGKTMPDASPPLAIWTQSFMLPPRKPNGLFYLAASQLGASMAQARELVDALMPTTTQITFVHIGDLLLMGFPCEPTALIGLEAKKMARAASYKSPAVVALTNDWLAYALTPEQYKAGKYEAVMSFYGDTFGTILLNNLKVGVAAEKAATAKP